MPYELSLLAALKKAGWKVKIRDAERLEEPHVTVLWKYKAWRVSLRTGLLLEEGQSWSEIDEAVRKAIEEHWEKLREVWDALYPHNPVSSEKDDDNN